MDAGGRSATTVGDFHTPGRRSDGSEEKSAWWISSHVMTLNRSTSATRYTGLAFQAVLTPYASAVACSARIMTASVRSCLRVLLRVNSSRVSSGPQTTSTPTSSRNSKRPPASASYGGGYQMRKMTAASAAASSALTSRCSAATGKLSRRRVASGMAEKKSTEVLF